MSHFTSGPDDSRPASDGAPEIDPEHAGSGFGSFGRRAMLLAGLGALVGCASGTSRRNLPGALWPEPRQLAGNGTTVPALPGATAGTVLPGVTARTGWARGNPIPSKVNRMTTPRYITIHHDGMKPFSKTGARDVAAQIELIRSVHVGNNGWGDIGYHYVVDRSGRAWEARPIKYQGAHVQFQNPGNIGVLCLGNFEEQVPSSGQLAGLRVLLAALASKYRIHKRNVLTHQEWSTARTACPGRNLQSQIVAMRRSGTLV